MPTGKPGLIMKPRGVSFPDDLWDEAGEVGEQVGVPRAEIVRDGTRREIARLKKREARKARKKR